MRWEGRWMLGNGLTPVSDTFHPFGSDMCHALLPRGTDRVEKPRSTRADRDSSHCNIGKKLISVTTTLWVFGMVMDMFGLGGIDLLRCCCCYCCYWRTSTGFVSTNFDMFWRITWHWRLDAQKCCLMKHLQ